MPETLLRIGAVLIMSSVIAFLFFAMQGCAPIITSDETRGGAGQAGYRYERETTADGTERCTVEVASGRPINAGSIEVGKDCTLKAQADADAQGAAALQSQTLNVLDTALKRLPLP